MGAQVYTVSISSEHTERDKAMYIVITRLGSEVIADVYDQMGNRVDCAGIFKNSDVAIATLVVRFSGTKIYNRS